jgi:hypothetical protein
MTTVVNSRDVDMRLMRFLGPRVGIVLMRFFNPQPSSASSFFAVQFGPGERSVYFLPSDSVTARFAETFFYR